MGAHAVNHHSYTIARKLYRRGNPTESYLRTIVAILKPYQGNDDHWYSNSINCPFGVGIWKAKILVAIFGWKYKFKDGNGRKILFWHDNWLGHGPLIVMFLNFCTIATLPDINLESAKGVTWVEYHF